MKILTVAMPARLNQKLQRIARRERRSKSAQVVFFLEQLLPQLEQQTSAEKEA